MHFRSIDVDDPSAGMDASNAPVNNPIDDDSQLSEHDNRGQIGGEVWKFAYTDTYPGARGIAYAQFSSGVQPGDNYRVVASTTAEWLERIRPVVPSKVADLKHDTEPFDQTEQASKLLTVWRVLNFEMDYLDSSVLVQTLPVGEALSPGVIVLDVSGKLTNVDDARDKVEADGVPGGFIASPYHPNNNDWAWADVWLNWKEGVNGQQLKVKKNGRKELRFAAGTNLSDVRAGADFRLSDDRVVMLDGKLPLGLSEFLLQSAYIRIQQLPEGHALNPFAKQGFVGNNNLGELFQLPKDVASSEAFWAVRLLDAYEGYSWDDNDPSDPAYPETTRQHPTPNERATRGESWGVVQPGGRMQDLDLLQPVSNVYRETIRDWMDEEEKPDAAFGTYLEFITAHEAVCHPLGLGDAPDGHPNANTLCGGSGLGTSRLSDDQVSRIRGLSRPSQVGSDR